jgi:tetratricopeptide (TPR) repeat protein
MYKKIVSRSFVTNGAYCILFSSLVFVFLQNNGPERSLQFSDSNIPKDLYKFNSITINNTNNSNSSLGQYQSAIELYDKALKIDPNNTDTISNKGIAFVILQDYAQASLLFDKALALDPNHVASLFYKGIVLDKSGKHGDAVKYYRTASELDPNYTGDLINRVAFLKEDFKVDVSGIRSALNITQQSR